MAKRSVKLDVGSKVTKDSLDLSTKKVSGFNADMTSIVSSVSTNPTKFVAAGLSKNDFFSNVTSPFTDLANDPVVINNSFFGLELGLSEGPVNQINSFIASIRDPLTSLNSLLSAVNSLLEVLKSLNLASDDILYALIQGAIRVITTIVDALVPQLGVHILTVPPHIPSTKILNTSVDDKLSELYKSFLEFNKDDLFGTLGANQSFITEDLAYTPKGFPTASSAEGLRNIILQSLEDKYDYMRPFHSPGLEAASNSGHSAGIILTAGGTVGSVLNAFRIWETFIHGLKSKEKTSDAAYEPRITESEYLGTDTSGNHKVSISFSLAGHSYDPSVRYDYYPFEYSVGLFLITKGSLDPGDYIAQVNYLSSLIDPGEEILETVFRRDTLSGVVYGHAHVARESIDFPFLDSSSNSNKLVHNYLSIKNYTEFYTLLKESDSESAFTTGSTVRVVVTVKYRDSSGEELQLNSSTNILLSKPDRYEISASRATAPNWQGASAGLKPLDAVSDYLNELTSGLTSMFERGVTNPLDASINIVQDYIQLIQRYIETIDDLIATLSVLANFNLSGFGTSYAADKGVRGIEKAVNNHFDELKKRSITWEGQSTAAFIMLAQSDALQDLQTFIAILELLFGSAKKNQGSKTIGQTIDLVVVPEEPIVSQTVLPLTESQQEFQTFDESMNPSACGMSPEDI